MGGEERTQVVADRATVVERTNRAVLLLTVDTSCLVVEGKESRSSLKLLVVLY
jgi:hypothetical protein